MIFDLIIFERKRKREKESLCNEREEGRKMACAIGITFPIGGYLIYGYCHCL